MKYDSEYKSHYTGEGLDICEYRYTGIALDGRDFWEIKFELKVNGKLIMFVEGRNFSDDRKRAVYYMESLWENRELNFTHNIYDTMHDLGTRLLESKKDISMQEYKEITQWINSHY